MRRMRSAVWFGVVAIAMGLFGTGCGGGGSDSSSDGGQSLSEGTPAEGLDVNGFWEGTAPDGTTAAATFSQAGGNVTADEAKINKTGKIVGTLSGLHMAFNMIFDDGTTVAGEGDFDSAGMTFNGTLTGMGAFDLLWRGPSFEQHNPLGEPLTYSK